MRQVIETYKQRDFYPSRTGGRTRVRERLDPVVYSNPDQVRDLPADFMESYRRDGFLLREQLFSEAELSVLRGELERMRRQSARLEADSVIKEPESADLRSVFRVHEQSAVFHRLTMDSRLVRTAEAILNDRVYIHQSRVNYKPGLSGKEFYWHSDFETWHVEDGMPRMRALSVSINLLPNSALNGPLLMIPGSHRLYVSCPGETPPEHYRSSLRRQEYGVPDAAVLEDLVQRNGIRAVTGEAGTTVFFDCNVMHGSNGNITPYPRSNVFIVYNAVSNRVRRPFGSLPPRPDFLASRDECTPVEAKEGSIADLGR